VRIDGHYDREADIAWLRLEGYDPSVVAEEIDTGLREIDPATGATVGLEYWHASSTLPAGLLSMLPRPGSASPPRTPRRDTLPTPRRAERSRANRPAAVLVPQHVPQRSCSPPCSRFAGPYGTLIPQG